MIVNVAVIGMAPIKFECLEGYEPTREQVDWIVELYMKEYLEMNIQRRINCTISMEEQISWMMHDSMEEERIDIAEQEYIRIFLEDDFEEVEEE